MSFKTLKDFDLKGKVVLLRADLNVPAKDGKVTDTTRIDRLKPTIDYLKQQGARTLILSHFGRPKGEVNPEFSLSFLPDALKASWGVEVGFATDCVGDVAKAAANGLEDGGFVLLENLRFHKGEENNSTDFVHQLADLGDIYINDAFSTAHRAHASTEGVAHLLPTGAGFLMEAELNALNNALENPKRPVAAIVGGAKISTKLTLLSNLVRKVDVLILGGGMANTFLYAQGHDIGGSLCEKDMVEQAQNVMEAADSSGCMIMLPEDCAVVSELKEGVEYDVSGSTLIPETKMAVDIGPETIITLKDKLSGVKTVLWNGPMGVFEVEPFDKGTNDIAAHVAELTKSGVVVSVAGGGDTVAALENAGVADDFTYISTAGGAFLEWLEGKTLPGVAALSTQKNAA